MKVRVTKRGLKNSKMLLVISLTVTFILMNCSKNATQPQNHPPAIQSLSSTPTNSSIDRVVSGARVILTVVAVDEDKDPLTYTWACSGGSIISGQSTNVLTWEAPIILQDNEYIISVNVSDGAATIKSDMTVYVTAPTSGIAVLPTTLDFGQTIDTLKIKIFNSGGGNLKWEIQNPSDWLITYPITGTLIQSTDTAYSQIVAKRSTLNPGTYTQKITVLNADNTTNKVTVSISLVVPTNGYIEGHTYYAGTSIPVSGVTVSAGGSFYTTVSDGYYRLDRLIPGSYTIGATKQGYDQFQADIVIGQGGNTKDISMTSALYTHNLYGRIVSAGTMQPLQDVLVTVLNDNGTGSQLQTRSDFNGNYQVPTVPQGQRRIGFQKQNYQDFISQIFMSNSDYLYNAQLSNKPGIPSNPFPASNESNVLFSTLLKWNCTDPSGDAITYDVYFGVDNPPITRVASGQSVTSFTVDAPMLTASATNYFWQVVASDNKGNSTSSPVWSFSSPQITLISQDLMLAEGGQYIEDELDVGGGTHHPRSVTVSDFHIAKHEVTQKLWRYVVQWKQGGTTTPLNPDPSYFKGDNRPVESVSWNDVQTWISYLNEMEGTTKYRLPTEAEWEYAARGGNQSKKYVFSGSGDVNEVAWYDGNSGGTTHECGMKKPNELGIFDMSGNVWEYCSDWYEESWSTLPQFDPVGPAIGTHRVTRSGSYSGSFTEQYICLSRYYHDVDPRYGYSSDGFRIARSD